MKRRSHVKVKGLLLPIAAACSLIVCLACANAGEQISPERTALAESEAAVPEDIRVPVASGTEVIADAGVTLDASNTAEGYVMVKSGGNPTRLKTRITNGAMAYNYDQRTDEVYDTYPLQMGDGDYDLQVLEQVEGTMYSRIFAAGLDVKLKNQQSPFLYSNQYVSYTPDSEAVKLAYRLTGTQNSDAEIAKKLYRYVSEAIDYDYEKAASVHSGYLPSCDATLSEGKGICFDYSALLATMLRARGIPTKLIIGYVAPDNLYHAWNAAFIGGSWVFYDATFAREARPEENYTAERVY